MKYSEPLRRATLGCLVLVSLGFSISACNGGADEKQEGLLHRLHRHVRDATDTISDMKVGDQDISKLAQDEFEKLFRVEYQVFDLSPTSNAATMQEALNNAGKDRWDCYHIEHLEATVRVFCKRQPKSYLRYIPRAFN